MSICDSKPGPSISTDEKTLVKLQPAHGMGPWTLLLKEEPKKKTTHPIDIVEMRVNCFVDKVETSVKWTTEFLSHGNNETM